MNSPRYPIAEQAAIPPIRSVRVRLLLSLLGLFLITSGVFGFFTFATFDRLYSQANIDRYEFLTDRLRLRLESRMCPDQTSNARSDCVLTAAVAQEQGFGGLLADFQAEASNLTLVQSRAAARPEQGAFAPFAAVMLRDGRVLQSTARRAPGSDFPQLPATPAGSAKVYDAEHRGWRSVVLPLRDSNGRELAELHTKIDESVLKQLTAVELKQHKDVLFMVNLCGAGVLVLVLGLAIRAHRHKSGLPKRIIMGITLGVVCATQLLSFLAGAFLFQGNYPHLVGLRTEAQAETLKTYLETSALPKAAHGSLDQVRLAEKPLRASNASGSDGDQQKFELLNYEGIYLYTVSYRNGAAMQIDMPSQYRPEHDHLLRAAPHAILIPVSHGSQRVGYLFTQIDGQATADEILSMTIEALITVVITLLCLVELIILVFTHIEKRLVHHESATAVHYSVMRPVMFLFLFGIDFSAALIPLQMERLYQPILGLPRDVVLGLPVSAMFLTVGITFIISGAWMDRRGWHEPFVIGVLITGVSKFYAWLAPDAIQFTLAMAGIGVGYGLALMAAQGFVMANTTDKNKAHGIAYFFAGVYAGSIGGTAIGAMLAERIGYDWVFLLGSLFIFASFACGIAFLRKSFHDSRRPLAQNVQSAPGKQRFLRFFFDRNVITLIVFCSIPAAVATIGFLNYFSPVYLNRLGVSESMIGGILTLYGISLVYVSPLVSKIIDTTERKELFIFAGCVLAGCAFLSFGIFAGLAATITAVLLLGLSMSCLQSSQTVYTLKLAATQRYGGGKAVAIVRASSRIGQMLGPMVFSGLMIAGNTERAVTHLGLLYLVIALLFITLRKRESEQPQVKKVAEEVSEPSEA